MVHIYFVILYFLSVYKSVGCVQVLKNDITNNDHHWDFLIFTQHWPITVCEDWKHYDQSHTCKFPKQQDSWTIHGIWPTKNGSMGPGFCNNSWHFDPELIKPIESTLLENWIDVENRTTEYSLWIHEWTKHGTCAATLDTLNSEYKYFNKGIEWLKTYNMNLALFNSTIFPSDEHLYSLSDIQAAIKSYWHVNPQIECRNEKGIQYLFEMRLCFDKNLELMDCYGDPNTILTNCDRNKKVLFAKTLIPRQSSNTLVEIYKFVTWLRWFTI